VSVLLIEAVRRLGRIEPGAAMGVVFSAMFAGGVLLLEQSAASGVHLDVQHALYGNLESLIWFDGYGWGALLDAQALRGLPPELLRRAAVLGVYSLGKAQRVLAGLSPGPGPVMVHGAIEASNAVLRAAGVVLPDTVPVTPEMPRGAAARTGALVLAPPSALDSAWMRRLGPAETALASGWMALRGIRRRRGAARGFVLSDHADWPGLNAAVRATGAARVWLTHGYTVPFARYLAETGLAAEVPETRFARDGAEDEA